jgi:hypothetical protein
MSEWFGVNNAVGWGCAPPAAQAWWEAHGCNTHSQKYPCHNPPAPCDAPGCTKQLQGRSDSGGVAVSS